MAAVWLVASIANLFSASLARRLGLIKTIVLVNVPAILALALIPFAPNWWWLLILLLCSATLGSMEQAPRMAFVAAVFSPSERTAVMGTINLVRTVAASGGPLLTGYFHEKEMWYATFYSSAVLKTFYVIGLLAMFLKTKLPEHERGLREVTVTDVDAGILLSDRLDLPGGFQIIEDEELDDDNESIGDRARSNSMYKGVEAA